MLVYNPNQYPIRAGTFADLTKWFGDSEITVVSLVSQKPPDAHMTLEAQILFCIGEA